MNNPLFSFAPDKKFTKISRPSSPPGLAIFPRLGYNKEKKIPQSWITSGKNYVTQECIDYMQPLIMGEKFPDYEDGLPAFSVLKNDERDTADI